jgi:dihydropyrimidinase
MAKFNGLYPRRGSIVVVGDADLVVFDPKWTGKMGVASSLHAVEFSLYERFEQKGRSEMVFLRGNLVVEDGKYTGQLGQGNFLKAEPYGAAYDSLR